MILHASLPADNPQATAQVLARLLGGVAMPFPPVPGCWMAWSADGMTELEITPRGQDVVWGEREAEWRDTPRATRSTDWHLAIGTCVSGEEVLRIATEAGWPARLCQRATFFACVEVWVEGSALLEVLDPAMQADYRASMTPSNWQKTFGLGAAA